MVTMGMSSVHGGCTPYASTRHPTERSLDRRQDSADVQTGTARGQARPSRGTVASLGCGRSAMPIRVAPHHKTTYSYDQPVPLSPHEVHLCPAPHARTPVVSYSLRVTPEQHFINWQQDPYGDWVARLVFSEPTRQLSLMVDRLHRGRPDVRVDHVGQGKWYPGEPLP